MNVSRRDLLKLAAGSAVGILFTPLPWKVLDDTAIWTQNWPWIPEPPKGETTSSSTTCTLCPAGCGMKARCVNGMPVSLSGIPGHPFGNGSLCAVGLAAHHLSFHPLRVRQPLHRIHARGGINSSVVTNEEALTMLLLAIRQSTGSVAILDRRPGRSISLAYRQWLGRLSNGVYLSSPSIECQTAHFTALNSNRQDSLGYDLEHARTILSFGTPLFGGWGSPGRMMKIAAQRRSSGSPMVIQVETRQSRTALMADTWIPVAPGTEGVFALGLAYVLLNERLIQPLAQDLSAFHDLAATFTPEKVAAHTGVSADIIIATARRIAGNLPAVAIGGGDPGAGPWSDADMTAVASLNTLFGAVGIQGGLLPRRDIPGVQDSGQQFAFERTLQGIPDHSIAVLIMDGAEDGCLLPWELIEPKLANERALVVSLSPFLAGLARRANLIIPSPVPLERWDDVPTPPNTPAPSYAIASPMIAQAEGSVDPFTLVQQLASGTGVPGGFGSAEETIKRRVAEIYTVQQGSIFEVNTCTPIKDVVSADRLFEMIRNGGVWIDETRTSSGANRCMPIKSDIEELRAVLLQSPSGGSGSTITVMPFGWKGTAGTGQISPILSKIYQESGLRPSESHGFVHSSTMAALTLVDGASATLTAGNAICKVIIHRDSSAMPGVIHVAAGPDPEIFRQNNPEGLSTYSLCMDAQGIWRLARVLIAKG